jgi:hypothetical protein
VAKRFYGQPCRLPPCQGAPSTRVFFTAILFGITHAFVRQLLAQLDSLCKRKMLAARLAERKNTAQRVW